MTHVIRTILCLLILPCVLTPAAAGAQSACDRDCLRGFMTRYLEALVRRDPSELPVAADLKFTEDNVRMQLGEGLWKTLSRVLPYRQEVIDVQAGISGAHVLVEDAGSPAMAVVRLKVVDGRIAEVETMVVRNRDEGLLFEPGALTAVSPAMQLIPDEAQRNARDEAVRIAASYPAGLRAGSFVTVNVPFAADAYRFENGRLMAGPGCSFLPGCDNIKTQRIPTLPETVYRLAAVDEELGIVWFRLDFGAGSTGPSSETKLIVWEAFKVYGGQIHAVEAFMETAPLGAGSGWQE